MANPTTNLSIVLPEPGAESSRGTWGTTINDAFQYLDTVISGRSIPTGGTDNQVLTKDGNLVDYQTEWSDRLSSVAISGSDGIEVDSGSPITSSGTIALGINKATLLSFLNAEDGATADQVATEVKALLVDGIDSVHYKDGSIDTIHIDDLQVTTGKLADDAVTADKLANSINTAIAANTSKVTNATHTGDVTGGTALTLATSGVSAATYGTATTIPVLAIDAKGRVTSASTIAVSIGTVAEDAATAAAIALG